MHTRKKQNQRVTCCISHRLNKIYSRINNMSFLSFFYHFCDEKKIIDDINSNRTIALIDNGNYTTHGRCKKTLEQTNKIVILVIKF